MVDKWTTPDDKRTWTFTLRDGLELHDGTPVTGEDVVPSLKRWGGANAGAEPHDLVVEINATRSQHLPHPAQGRTGFMLDALGKPSSNVPFIMPKRVADTDPTSRSTTTPAPARISS